MTTLTWHNLLSKEKKQPYFIKIMKTINEERKLGFTIYPPQKDIFNVFRFTEFNKIKVVILGQDPYHGANQAHGLAFSVLPGRSIPPSLFNIYRELRRSIPYFIIPDHGYLKSWANQGVFLLNTSLTVRAGQANSHSNLFWEIFTDKVIGFINTYLDSIVFLLWGSHAKKKEKIIDEQRHYILKTSHPSPLSATRGFFGCNHFVLTNRWLEQHGKQSINWFPSLFKKRGWC